MEGFFICEGFIKPLFNAVRAATSYAKFNNVNVEDEQSAPYDMIVVQPFTATSDPSVLGIKPIPNIEKVISDMIEKYRAESLDIDE